MMGKDKKAIMCLEEVLKMNPNNTDAREAIKVCQDKKALW